MGLSTHVLDTMHGTPAAGMGVALYVTNGDDATLVKRFTLNADGRNPDGPLYDNASLKAGDLPAGVRRGGLLQGAGRELARAELPELRQPGFRRGKCTDEHYHVPLLVSPWSYSRRTAVPDVGWRVKGPHKRRRPQRAGGEIESRPVSTDHAPHHDPSDQHRAIRARRRDRRSLRRAPHHHCARLTCANNCIAPAPRRAVPMATAAPAWCWSASSMPTGTAVDYRPVNSCLQLLPTLDGKSVKTVESLKRADGGLHPVQEAMVACHGSQCGSARPAS
jgi:5-hydroxyisourate hydrolase